MTPLSFDDLSCNLDIQLNHWLNCFSTTLPTLGLSPTPYLVLNTASLKSSNITAVRPAYHRFHSAYDVNVTFSFYLKFSFTLLLPGWFARAKSCSGIGNSHLQLTLILVLPSINRPFQADNNSGNLEQSKYKRKMHC